ncbi:FeoB-associated Cys-rich membrane protein [Ferdinandcohnia sp. Marseille-Q9671]
MTIVFLAIVVGVVSFSVIKLVRKKRLPSNTYTPFDDMTMGKRDEK